MLTEKIGRLALKVAQINSVKLFDVEIAGSKNNMVVKVFIDKEGGVTIDDCANFSRDLSAEFDIEDPIDSKYTLEVSSPGLTRPLKKAEHFVWAIGKPVLIKLRGGSGKGSKGGVVKGKIVSADDDGIEVAPDADSSSTRIEYGQIAKANLELE
jgi:ribosome maturation factor RimP